MTMKTAGTFLCALLLPALCAALVPNIQRSAPGSTEMQILLQEGSLQEMQVVKRTRRTIRTSLQETDLLKLEKSGEGVGESPKDKADKWHNELVAKMEDCKDSKLPNWITFMREQAMRIHLDLLDEKDDEKRFQYFLMLEQKFRVTAKLIRSFQEPSSMNNGKGYGAKSYSDGIKKMRDDKGKLAGFELDTWEALMEMKPPADSDPSTVNPVDGILGKLEGADKIGGLLEKTLDGLSDAAPDALDNGLDCLGDAIVLLKVAQICQCTYNCFSEAAKGCDSCQATTVGFGVDLAKTAATAAVCSTAAAPICTLYYGGKYVQGIYTVAKKIEAMLPDETARDNSAHAFCLAALNSQFKEFQYQLEAGLGKTYAIAAGNGRSSYKVLMDKDLDGKQTELMGVWPLNKMTPPPGTLPVALKENMGIEFPYCNFNLNAQNKQGGRRSPNTEEQTIELEKVANLFGISGTTATAHIPSYPEPLKDTQKFFLTRYVAQQSYYEQATKELKWDDVLEKALPSIPLGMSTRLGSFLDDIFKVSFGLRHLKCSQQ